MLPTIFDSMTLISSITNFGSELPDPNGPNELTSLKKVSFKALGAITVLNLIIAVLVNVMTEMKAVGSDKESK